MEKLVLGFEEPDSRPINHSPCERLALQYQFSTETSKKRYAPVTPKSLYLGSTRVCNRVFSPPAKIASTNRGEATKND